MDKLRWSGLFTIFIVLVSFSASGQPVFSMDAEGLYPVDHIEYFCDTEGDLSFQEVRQRRFQPVASLSFGYSDAAHWVRLRLRNTSPYDDWRLFQPITFTDYLDYYIKTEAGNWKQLKTGRNRPFYSRQNDEHVGFVFPLALKPGETCTVYFRLQGNPISFPLEVIREDTLDKRFEQENLYYGLYFGVLIVMALYNLFLYFSLRNRNYLYYVLSILATFVVFSGSTGYLFRYLHPDLPWLNYYQTRPFMGVLVITSALFAMHFLEIRKVSTWLYRIFLADIGLALVAILLTITDVMPKATNTLTTLHAPFLLLAGIVAWRKGNASARYYVLAWVFFIVGGLLTTLRNAGVLPANLITNHSAEVGSLLEIVLLSFALADRYRVIRQEKEAATRHALEVQEKANRELEGKVKERTAALQDRNEELNQMNEELDMTLNTVQLQKNEIEHQNEQIHASINYARRIQRALLPSEPFLKKYITDAFVLFRPRDVVSGDFYYVLQRDQQTVLALADCTGHGVPGAFMSMMGVNLMERVFSEDENRKPDEAIRILDRYIASAFLSSEDRVRDGMDAALCLIDHPTQTIYFAGAKLPLVQVRDGKAIRHRGSRVSIGGEERIQKDQVSLHRVKYRKGDRFFMFSDGYQDQFGGPKEKKFMSRRFRKLLAQTADLSPELQRERLNKTLEDWMAEAYEKQTDDILVIGFIP